jgi:hypothetical protein
MRIAGLTLVVALFAAPAFGQDANRNDPKDTKSDYEKAYRSFTGQLVNPDAEKLRADLKSLEALLEQKVAETQKIKAQMEQLRARMKMADQQTNKEAKPDTMRVWLDVGDPKQGPQEIILRHVDGAWQIVPAKEKDKKGDEKPAKPAWQVQPSGPAVPPGLIWRVPDGGTAPQARPDADQRIENLEKKLDKLMNNLEQMRKEMDGSRKKAGSEEDATRLKAVEALSRIAVEKKDADLRAAKRAQDAKLAEEKKDADLRAAGRADEAAKRAAQDQAEEAERKALKQRQKAVQDELDRVNALRRELEAELKKAEENKKKESPR